MFEIFFNFYFQHLTMSIYLGASNTSSLIVDDYDDIYTYYGCSKIEPLYFFAY